MILPANTSKEDAWILYALEHAYHAETADTWNPHRTKASAWERLQNALAERVTGVPHDFG